MTSIIVRADGTTVLSGVKSVTYVEKVNADTDLRPGCVASAYIRVEVYGAQEDAPAAGEALTYYQVQDNVETLIGTFYAEPSIPTKTTYAFTAYDAVAKLDVDFSAWLTAHQNDFPMSIYDLVSAACTVAGVTLGSASWPLSTQTVNAFFANVTCRNILQYAAEIACRFVRCDSAGEVIFDWYTTNSTYSIHPSNTQSGYIAYKQDGLEYANYSARVVEAVAIKPSGTDGAAYIYPTTYGAITATDDGEGNIILTNISVSDNSGNLTLSADAEDDGDGNVEISSSAAASNTLILGNNLLLTNATPAVFTATAQNIYTVLSALGAYRPARINLFPFENPFRAGEIISVTDAQGVTFNTVSMGVTVSNSVAVIESTGNEVYADESNTQKTLTQLASDIVQINKLKVDWAEIDTAVINTIKATGINTDWLISSEVTASAINLTAQSTIKTPDENNPETLLPNQTISNGWIVRVPPATLNYVCYGNYSDMSYMMGKTITITCECLGSPPSSLRVVKQFTAYEPGSEYPFIGDDGWEWTSEPIHIPEADYKDNGQNIYLYSYTETFGDTSDQGYTVTVWNTFSLEVDVPIRRVKITMSDGTVVSLSGRGLEIGGFTIDRNGVGKYSGSRLLTENTGVKKSGDTMTGNLVINGSTDVGSILTALTADSGWTSLNPLSYRKVGTIVYITSHSLSTAVSSIPATTWTTVCTLPSGYRPSQRIDAAASLGYNADVPGAVRIGTDGAVEVWASAAVSSPYITFSTSYPV